LYVSLPACVELLSLFAVAAIVAFIVVTAFKSQLLKDNPSNLAAIEPMWRLLIGLGCIPSVAAMYFRLTISETPRFTMDIERNVQQADRDIQGFLANGSRFLDPDAVITRTGAPTATRRDFAAYFGKWDNFKVLFGTSWSWFALDVCSRPSAVTSHILIISLRSPSMVLD
jgi:PHS family inorganic phosphate transporter-like MFS transporter